MSRILKSIINSAIEDDRRFKILYYPSGSEEIDKNVLNLDFDFYLPIKNDTLLTLPNVFFQENVINSHLSIVFDSALVGNPIIHFNNAANLSVQMHIPLVCLFLSKPNGLKKEMLFSNAEKMQKNSISIAPSKEIAAQWYLSNFELINNISDIYKVIKKCRIKYIRN